MTSTTSIFEIAKFKFSLEGDCVLVSGNQPGSHATLFSVAKGPFPFRDDASSFDNHNRRYTWAFAHGGRLHPGDRLVFATDAGEAIGVVTDVGTVETVVDSGLTVRRREDGKPIQVRAVERGEVP